MSPLREKKTSILYRRLFDVFPILLGVSFITFIVFHVVGVDPTLEIAGKYSSEEQIATIRQTLGLQEPLLIRYLNYLKKMIFFDFGHSFYTQENVASLIYKGLFQTLLLTLPPYIISILSALLLGLYSCYKEPSWSSRILVTLAFLLSSISSLAYVIILQYLLSYYYNIFPTSGWPMDVWQIGFYLAMPWIILTILRIGPNFLVFRSLFLEQKQKLFVRTSQSKGNPNYKTYGCHILTNSLATIATLVTQEIPFLITGSVVIESFFSIPGLGSILVRAIQNGDFPIINAMTLLGTFVYVLLTLASDLFAQKVDSRILLS